jgi:hypothetical protein
LEMTQTSIHIQAMCPLTMDEGLPPRIPFLPDCIVHHAEGLLVTGMEGEVIWLDQNFQPVSDVKTPHPMRFRQASISNGQLYATWLDRELLLACMGSMPVGVVKEGRPRSEIRTSMGTQTMHYPAGTTWSHALDAEPMALKSDGEIVVFLLYNRGIYKIGTKADERWRMPPPEWRYPKKRPRNEEPVALHLEEEVYWITSRGGRVQRRSLETGHLIEEFLLEGVEAPVEHHFKHEDQHLACSSTGMVTWILNGEVKQQIQLSGPVQDAMWDQHLGGWRIAGWREEVFLSDRMIDRRETRELPVHVCPFKGGGIVLFNDGSWETSPFE